MKKNILLSYSLLLLLTILSCSTSPDKVLFVVAGQSNARGAGDSLTSPDASHCCFEYNSKAQEFIPLKDPVGQYHMGFQKARTGSFTPSLASHFYERTKANVYIVQTAKGGSALHPKAEQKGWGVWGTNGDLLQKSFQKIDSAQAKANLNLRAIIWSQGENDGVAIAQNKISIEDYKSELNRLIDQYLARYEEADFVIVSTGTHSIKSNNEGFSKVRKVQEEVANSREKVHIGYNKTQTFADKDWLKDPVHYNQKALNDIGKGLAEFIDKL